MEYKIVNITSLEAQFDATPDLVGIFANALMPDGRTRTLAKIEFTDQNTAIGSFCGDTYKISVIRKVYSVRVGNELLHQTSNLTQAFDVLMSNANSHIEETWM